MTGHVDGRYRFQLEERIRARIVEVPDWPKPGVSFKDISPIFEDADLFRSTINYFANLIPSSTTKFFAIDARGFLIASPLAMLMGKPLVLCRKAGKLPRATLSQKYDLEYGQSELFVTEGTASAKDKVFVIDDLLATGGTAWAAGQLALRQGAELTGYGFLVELSFLGGRKRLAHSTITAIAQY